MMLSLLSFAVSKSTHHLTLHAVSNFRHIASQRNSITSLKMTPNVVLIFCYGDSLTHGSSSPPTFSSFPIGPHLERELNQSIDNVTRLIMARSRFCYFTSLLVGVDIFYSHSDNLMFEVNGETRNSSNEMLRFSSIVCQNRQYYRSLWQQFCLAARYC